MSTFLVMGQNRWGRGSSVSEAKHNFRQQGARLGYGYVLVEFPPPLEFTGVDQMGYYHWTHHGSATQPIVTEFEPRKQKV